MTSSCAVCADIACEPYRIVDGVQFLACTSCGCLLAEPSFMHRVAAGDQTNYDRTYWDNEVIAAEQRSFGSSLTRVAEVFRTCRIPIERFIDIGSGAGALLDSLEWLLPELRGRFHGIELFPPEQHRRSRHPNYHVGTLGCLTERFDAGVCIEVIEHLTPAMVRTLASELADRATPGALFYFNSAQPSFVASHDPNYLDPLGRGHIASYSVAGAAHLFGPAGFRVIALPGRDWAFLAEFTDDPAPVGSDQLFDRLWHPNPQNMHMLASARFGPLMIAIGLEASRCYLEHAAADNPARWVLDPRSQLPPAPGGVGARIAAFFGL
jgi:hypothetical protein